MKEYYQVYKTIYIFPQYYERLKKLKDNFTNELNKKITMTHILNSIMANLTDEEILDMVILHSSTIINKPKKNKNHKVNKVKIKKLKASIVNPKKSTLDKHKLDDDIYAI